MRLAFLRLALVLGLVAPASGIAELPRQAPPWLGGATLTVEPDGRGVAIDGEVAEGLAARVADLLRSRSGIRRVILTSEGGYVHEAEALGRLVAEHRLATYVPRFCISACTLVFVRGAERLAATGARLGFHAPFLTDERGQEVPVDSEDERRSYIAAGVDAEFAGEALRVAPADIWFPEPSRLLAARVVTRFVEARTSRPSERDMAMRSR